MDISSQHSQLASVGSTHQRSTLIELLYSYRLLGQSLAGEGSYARLVSRCGWNLHTGTILQR